MTPMLKQSPVGTTRAEPVKLRPSRLPQSRWGCSIYGPNRSRHSSRLEHGPNERSPFSSIAYQPLLIRRKYACSSFMKYGIRLFIVVSIVPERWPSFGEWRKRRLRCVAVFGQLFRQSVLASTSTWWSRLESTRWGWAANREVRGGAGKYRRDPSAADTFHHEHRRQSLRHSVM